MRLRVVSAVVASAFAVVPALVTPAGAATPLRVATARYSFDGTGSGVLLVSGTVKLAPHALFSLVTVDTTDPAQPDAFFPQVIDLDPRDGARTFGAVGNHDVCAAPLTCDVQDGVFGFGIGSSVSGDRKHAIHLRMYVAVRGARVSVRDGVRVGWRAVHHAGGLTVRSDADAAGAGVATEGIDAGALTGVAALGGRRGSVAVLVPGCDVAGAGAASLSGGASSVTAICPTDAVAAYAPRRTSWSATGLTAGLSQNETRLVVIDN